MEDFRAIPLEKGLLSTEKLIMVLQGLYDEGVSC
jgi:hypothetical protein